MNVHREETWSNECAFAQARFEKLQELVTISFFNNDYCAMRMLICDLVREQKCVRELNKRRPVTSWKLKYIRDFDFNKWPFGF